MADPLPKQGKRTIWQSGILHVMPEGFNRASMAEKWIPANKLPTVGALGTGMTPVKTTIFDFRAILRFVLT